MAAPWKVFSFPLGLSIFTIVATLQVWVFVFVFFLTNLPSIDLFLFILFEIWPVPSASRKSFSRVTFPPLPSLLLEHPLNTAIFHISWPL